MCVMISPRRCSLIFSTDKILSDFLWNSHGLGVRQPSMHLKLHPRVVICFVSMQEYLIWNWASRKVFLGAFPSRTGQQYLRPFKRLPCIVHHSGFQKETTLYFCSTCESHLSILMQLSIYQNMSHRVKCTTSPAISFLQVEYLQFILEFRIGIVKHNLDFNTAH